MITEFYLMKLFPSKFKVTRNLMISTYGDKLIRESQSLHFIANFEHIV